MKSQILPFNLRSIFILGFMISSVFWISAVVLSEGPTTLIGPAGAGLLSGSLIILEKKGKLALSLITSSSIYNVIIMAYQAGSAMNLFSLGLPAFGLASMVGYTVGALFFALLSIVSLSTPHLFFHQERSSVESRRDKG